MRIRVLLSVLGLGLLVLACLAAARSDLAAADRLGRALSVAVIGAAVPLAPLLVERLRRPSRHGAGRGYAFRKSARAASSRSTSSSSL